MLDGCLAQSGAVELSPRVDVDKEDWAAINRWMDAVTTCLPKHALKTVQALGGKSPVSSVALT